MTPDESSQRFLNAGDEFRVGTARWWGDAVMSEDAIYLLQRQPARGRGLAAAFEVLADRLLPRRSLAGSAYVEIPDAIRSHAAWPARQTDYVAVVVVPKQEVAFLHHERGKLETRFIFKGVEIAIGHGRFGGKRVREFAEAARWPMLWDGEPVNLQDRSKRQLDEEVRALPFGRPVISYATITSGFLLGVLPMLLAAFPRMNQDVVNTLWIAGWLAAVALILFGWVALRRGF